MITTNTLNDSLAYKSYLARMKSEVAAVIEQTYALPHSFDIGEPEVKRSLHLEASALACHWIEAFSEENPEMLSWAKLFSKQLIHESEASVAFGRIGYPGEASNFFDNRLEYYRSNKAGWQPDKNLLTCCIGIVTFCAMLKAMKVPPMLGTGQEVEGFVMFIAKLKAEDLAELQTTLGIDPRSQEYFELIAIWLKDFTENLARIAYASNEAYLNAIAEMRNESMSAVNTMRTYKAICLVLAAWCLVLPFLDFDQIWVYQLTRIAVTIGAVFLAIIFGGWQMVGAVIVAILFNPIIPIEFDKDAWMVVDIAAALYFGFVGFWPSPQYRNKGAKSNPQF